VDDELLRPFDADTAHAIEETAKTAGKAVDAVAGTGKYLSQVLGQVPANLVGLLDDWLLHKRIRRLAELNAETREHLKRWGAEEPFEDPTPALAAPLIAAAIDEDREELKDLWARLLASAMHPDRKGRVRQSFVAILKQLDPLDALCLRTIGNGGNPSKFVARFGPDEIQVSLGRLKELALIHQVATPSLEALGKLFLAAVED
jgi:hypothetical protein